MHTLPLDPTIAALADQAGAPTDPIPWDSYLACTGVTRGHYFAAMASSLLMAGERLVAGYRVREDRARAARHLAYSEGAVKAPRKSTRAAEIMADARAFGLTSRVEVRPCGALWEGLCDGVVVCRDYTADGAASGARRAAA